MFDKFGLVSKNKNKAILWHFYCDLTENKSVGLTLFKKEVEKIKVNLLFDFRIILFTVKLHIMKVYLSGFQI